MPLSTRFRALHVCILFQVVIAMAPAIAAADAAYAFNLPAQSLADSLRAVGSQAKVNVAFEPSAVGDRLAPALQGSYSVQDALSRLLDGTKLGVRMTDGGSFVIATVDGLSGGVTYPTNGALSSRMRVAEGSGPNAMANADLENRDESQPEKLEEIVVTAQKRKENLQDVAVSVTALTSEYLRAVGAIDIKDVLRSVPGLSFAGAERGLGRYAIRGISNSGGGATAATVGTYLDDISLVTRPTGNTAALDLILFDMERVEVLKGPQGTLYGGSAMGGAIKYVSARPDLSERTGSVVAGVGTTEHGSESYDAQGVLNLPLISDVLALRAGFYYLHEGGYIDNVADGAIVNTAYSSTAFPTYTPLTQSSRSIVSEDDYNDSNTYVARVSLLWQPNESWSIRPMFLYQNTRSDNPPYFFPNLGQLTSSYRFVDQPTTDKTKLSSLEIVKSLGKVEVTSLTAYFDRDMNFGRDYSLFVGGLLPPYYPFDAFAHYPSHNRNFSQELRLASAPDSDSRLRWTAGIYYADENEQQDALVPLYGGPQCTACPPSFQTDIGYRADVSIETKQRAAFAEASYRVIDALEFTAGVRWFKYKYTDDTTSDGPFVGGFSHTTLSGKENGVNPKFGLSYKVNDDHLLYASAAKGFRPGAAQNNAFVNALCPDDIARLGITSLPNGYESDNLWSYELGSKNAFNEGGLIVNGALFYSDWNEIQQNIRFANCGLSVTNNGGTARVQGAELEAYMNLTSAFRLGGNATFTDAEITSDVAPPAQKGDDILDTPEWMASFYGSYSLPITATWHMTVRADYQYRSSQRQLYDSTQTVRFSDGVRSPVPYGAIYQESYDVLNAYASFVNGPTTVRLHVHNLFNAQPLLDEQQSIQVSRANTLRPRTIGLELRREF